MRVMLAAGGFGDLDGLVDDFELGSEAFGRGYGAGVRQVARR